jgi:hypothetical protein
MESASFPKQINDLMDRGVVCPAPASLEVGPEVDPARIAPGVILHTGTRLRGVGLSIGPDCVLGEEAPVTVEDCRLGYGVRLKGGFVSGSVFYDGSSLGSAAHVRPGTLLEEEASGAHAVGLKQTIFLPFVTAGSLLNFCDVLMAGGTSRADHGEIGSSFIHFNYSPHGDKATASMIGDVPRGVFLDQPPSFLGGQGGIVGPLRYGFGVVQPAGMVGRRDCLDDGRLVLPDPLPAGPPRAYALGAYKSVRRIVAANLAFMGNVRALREWTRLVRGPLFGGDAYRRACLEGALACLALILKERVKRLRQLAGNMERSLAHATDRAAPPWADQAKLAERWPRVEEALTKLRETPCEPRDANRFLAFWERRERATTYVEAVRSLDEEAKAAGRRWLAGLVAEAEACIEHFQFGESHHG